LFGSSSQKGVPKWKFHRFYEFWSEIVQGIFKGAFVFCSGNANYFIEIGQGKFTKRSPCRVTLVI
jgi:hypothetical protein